MAPSAIRALASDPMARSIPWQCRWTTDLRTCTVVTDYAVLDSIPKTIVKSEGDWTHRDGLPLRGLVWACVEAAIEGDDRAQPHMAWLTARLFEEFARNNPVLAIVFGELLKRCIWEEFEAWWKPGLPSCLSSFAYKGNKAALNLALAGVRFIGELYRLHMLPPSFLLHVLVIIHEGRWLSIEQLRAGRLLASYLDARIRGADPTISSKLMEAFSLNCRHVVGSWMGEAVDWWETFTLYQPSPPVFQKVFSGQPVNEPNAN
ncbi:hypothetical protein L226DRAFT_571903 [Lentinus tigrinus ALCF2SS1-7]|uniref:uncharacterized protein n=1 Tax=Lentinus tigrinus ALCF2SS1-7 TaxID=1328758 RepID=UPI0011660AB4|nr:hypothetical protein L226DRAFT_571903 [Lentinus tigrinus ALCF2SS1-7]